MSDGTLTCPECKSDNVTTEHVQLFMANTGEHYCHSTKTHDSDSAAGCLDCGWHGRRDELQSNAPSSPDAKQSGAKKGENNEHGTTIRRFSGARKP